jgi:hypothetical protein
MIPAFANLGPRQRIDLLRWFAQRVRLVENGRTPCGDLELRRIIERRTSCTWSVR